MDRMGDWIRTGVILLGFLLAMGTFSYESCVTRREMNEKFEQARADRALIRQDIGQLESRLTEDIRRVEAKVEQLNQNYIEHLAQHNKKD